MTTEQFRSALRAQPFRPFVLKTGSGALYPVQHPEMAMLSPGGRTVAVATGNDAIAVLDLLLVEAIEIGAAARDANP